MNQLNFHHLYYFYTIAKEGSISKACQKLMLSQPALSSQLKIFEHQLRRPLFERHKKRLHLTEDGRLVLDFATRIFDLGQQLEDSLRDRSPSGRQSIQVGVMNGTPRIFTDALVAHLLKKYPTAHVLVEEKSLDLLGEKLSNLNLDILLTDTPISNLKGTDCANLLIGRVPVVFAAEKSACSRFEKAMKDRQEVPLILPVAPVMMNQQVKDWLSHHHVKARIVAEVQDSSIAGRLALKGLGIAPMSAQLISQVPFKGKLCALKDNGTTSIYENLYLVTRHRQWPNALATELLKSFRIKK